MKIVVIGDTHNLHRQVQLPDGDLLIHTGDFTISGGTNPYDIEVIKDFDAWLGEQPHRYKVVVPGNHDRYFQDHPREARELITNARLVQDEAFEIEGLKFYASPWTPKFHSDYWRFHKSRGSELYAHWQNIPTGLDVLITHGPPKGVLDFVGMQHAGNGIIIGGEHSGDEMLYQAVMFKAKPKIHVFGHIHSGYGEVRYGDTQFYNAAQCGESYTVINRPWVFEYGETKTEVPQGDVGERDGARTAGDSEADATSEGQAPEAVEAN